MDWTRFRKGLTGATAAAAMIWSATVIGACSASPGTTFDTDASIDATSACGAGSEACGGVCTVVARDPENCGKCGTKCTTGQLCSQGACALSCGGGTTKCGDLCIDTKADSDNCGACGTKCTGGQVCSKGVCAGTCGAGLSQCSSSCVNEQNDRTNCGACGNVCGGGEICNAGKCELSCQVGLIKCSAPVVDGGVSDASVSDGGSLGTTFCANPMTDNTNCGACGITCGGGQVCSNGTCGTTCGGNTTTCGSGNNAYCANLQTDNANCGVCGTVCGAGKVCSNGTCGTTCGGSSTMCGSGNNAYCASLQTDNANCGVCGTVCGAGKVCSAGICTTTCGALTTCGSGNNAYCADTKSDPSNCGTCGKVCPAPANAIAACTGSACGIICKPGWADLNGLASDGCEKAIFPAACTGDKDVTGSNYVICAMNSTGAWISANNNGGGCTYSALAICQKYGFTKVARWGGTCGTICGYCNSSTCLNPQGAFSLGAGYTTYDNGGGNPQGGASISCTVQWECAP